MKRSAAMDCGYAPLLEKKRQEAAMIKGSAPPPKPKKVFTDSQKRFFFVPSESSSETYTVDWKMTGHEVCIAWGSFRRIMFGETILEIDQRAAFKQRRNSA